MRAGPLGDGLFDIAHADGADVALRLRDDEVGFQLAQQIGVHAIDGERLRENRFDALIDFGAGAFGVKFGTGERGQVLDLVREVAFVRSPDELIFKAERADDFSGAGQ
jgi:hypothetical protein